VFISEIDLASPRCFRSSFKISDDERSTEARHIGESAQDPSQKIMTPWTFNIKFSYNTQFTFGSLMFAAGKDGNLELLTRCLAPECLTPVYGQPPYLPTSTSISGGAHSGLNPSAGPYHRTAKTTQGILTRAPIFQPFIVTSSSSTSAVSPNQDSTDDYPEIGESTCWNSAN
jgi:hypothetical protein